MEFFLESVSTLGVRCGKLLKRNGFTIETPACLIYARGAAVPNVPQDFLQQLFPKDLGAKDGGEKMQVSAIQMTLPTVYEQPGTEVLHAFGEGIHKFANLENQFVYLSVQDPVRPPPDGYNEEKTTSIWTPSGRQKVSIESYMEFVGASKPDVFESFCDTPSMGVTSLNRIKKSVDRTLKFLDQTFEIFNEDTPVFGAIEGNDITSERKRSAKETQCRPVSGFILEGFDQEDFRNKELIIETTVELPPEKPRVLSKVSSPEGVFHAVEAGVDLVDGSYPYVLSERGHAMYWSRKGELAPPKYTERDLKLGSTVDLNENVYGGQYSPLVEHCTCYTCQNHTRSYLHHLLVTKELLAGVLLMIHNLHQYLNFFNDLRVAVKEDRYLSYRTLFSTKF